MVMVFKIIAIILFTITIILSFIGMYELKKDNIRRQKQYEKYPSYRQLNNTINNFVDSNSCDPLCSGCIYSTITPLLFKDCEKCKKMLKECLNEPGYVYFANEENKKVVKE